MQRLKINIEYECDVESSMYPEGVESLTQIIAHELNNFDFKTLMMALATDDYKYKVELAPEPRICIGFAEYEGRCGNYPAAGSPYFCSRCEILRQQVRQDELDRYKTNRKENEEVF